MMIPDQAAAYDPPRPATRGLPELLDFIRGRRAALAGFIEEGAALKLDGELLTVTARNVLYTGYLSDNREAIAELASELYGRRITAQVHLSAMPGGGTRPVRQPLKFRRPKLTSPRPPRKSEPRR